MSAPFFETKTDDYLGKSFLAIRTRNAISSLLDGRELSENDRVILQKAKKFLEDVSSGAHFVAKGSQALGAVKPVELMSALDYAMDPIETLKELIEDDKVADFFNEMATSVDRGINNPHEALATNKGMLEIALRFFEALYKSLSDFLDRNHNPLGDNFNQKSIGLA